MRNWNLDPILLNHLITFQFIACLWGIETDSYVKLNYMPALVYRVPMRNWNNTKFFIFDFEARPFIACLWGIETSLRRMLPCVGTHVYRVPMRNWNQCGHLFSRVAFSVYRVPMRNWNNRNKLDPFTSAPFIACLWGIETQVCYSWII